MEKTTVKNSSESATTKSNSALSAIAVLECDSVLNLSALTKIKGGSNSNWITDDGQPHRGHR